MILNSSNPFTRNGASKIAGLRKMLATVAKIEPGGPSLRLVPHQGELWVEHEGANCLLHRADKVDREMLRHGGLE